MTRPAGFTLVELLVVLVILGLAMGLVWPRLETMVDQTRYRRAHDAVLLEVDRLGTIARDRLETVRLGPDGFVAGPWDEEQTDQPRVEVIWGEAGRWGEGGWGDDDPDPEALPPPIDLPEGWQLSSPDGLAWLPSGACTGGRLAVADPDGRTREIELASPHCRALAR